MARGAGPGPLFHFRNGKLLTRIRLVEHVREALQRAGVDGTPYSGYSFRSGAATTAAKEGVEDSTIVMLEQCLLVVYQDSKGTIGSRLTAASLRS